MLLNVTTEKSTPSPAPQVMRVFPSSLVPFNDINYYIIKLCSKSPCTTISASSAVLAVQGLLRHILRFYFFATLKDFNLFNATNIIEVCVP